MNIMVKDKLLFMLLEDIVIMEEKVCIEEGMCRSKIIVV